MTLGMKKIKDPRLRHVGKWVTIFPRGITSSFSGLVSKLDDEDYVLNPTYTATYTTGKPVYGLSETDSYVPSTDAVIVYTTKKSLDGLAKHDNEEQKKQEEEKSKKEKSKK